jgi:hypothetical protein
MPSESPPIPEKRLIAVGIGDLVEFSYGVVESIFYIVLNLKIETKKSQTPTTKAIMFRLTAKHLLIYYSILMWIKFGYYPTLTVCLVYGIGLGYILV